MNILCRLGLHKWEKCYLKMTEPEVKLLTTKACSRRGCGMVQFPILYSKVRFEFNPRWIDRTMEEE